MKVPYCHLCDADPNEKRKYGETGLDEGDYCPSCNRPFCKHHAGIVRFRWKQTRQVDSTYVCKECKNAYLHRDLEPTKREWIS